MIESIKRYLEIYTSLQDISINGFVATSDITIRNDDDVYDAKYIKLDTSDDSIVYDYISIVSRNSVSQLAYNNMLIIYEKLKNAKINYKNTNMLVSVVRVPALISYDGSYYYYSLLIRLLIEEVAE